MRIKLFLSEHCNSFREAVSYFKEKGIEFEQIDVTRDREGFTEMLQLGGIAIPFIVIGDTIMHTFDRSRIAQLLEVLKDE